jgi:hypothetical protein
MKASIWQLIRLGLLASLGLGLSAPAAHAQAGSPLFQRGGDFENASAQAALKRLIQRPTTRRATLARVDRSAFDDKRITLNPFPELNLEALQTRIGFTGTRHRAWLGELVDNSGSAVFIIHGNRISGKINSTRGTFEIFPLASGGCVVVEHIPAAFPGCGVDDQAVSQRSRRRTAVTSPPTGDTADNGDVEPFGVSPTDDVSAGDSILDNRVRVIVAYTVGARIKTEIIYGRTMQEHIDLAIAESNQGYANSGVTLRMELACLYQTDSTETTAIENDVEDFRNDGDGKFDEVHPLRADYDADMCCLLTDGRDYAWSGWSYGFDYTSRENMFQATSYSSATGNFSFAHEFGHTQGCRHNDDLALTPFAYGHGFRNSSYWRTIMALANGTTAPRLNYWSNPLINSPVFPFTAMGTPVNGDSFANDCVTALNVGGNTVINHETTPATSTAPTNDSFDNDEYADKFVTDTLTVGVFTANPGAAVRFRAGSCIVLQPGFQARAGSEFRAYLSNPLGDPAADSANQVESIVPLNPSDP